MTAENAWRPRSWRSRWWARPEFNFLSPTAGAQNCKETHGFNPPTKEWCGHHMLAQQRKTKSSFNIKSRKWEAQRGLVIRRWVWFSSTKPNRAGPDGEADSPSHSERWIPQGLPGILSKTASEFKQTNQQKPQEMQLSPWVLAEQGQSPKLGLQHWTINQSIS